MKKKNLITKILEGAIIDPYYDEIDFDRKTNPLGITVNLSHAMGVVEAYNKKDCTLQDYEGCVNYKGDKKIPICHDCPYRGNKSEVGK